MTYKSRLTRLKSVTIVDLRSTAPQVKLFGYRRCVIHGHVIWELLKPTSSVDHFHHKLFPVFFISVLQASLFAMFLKSFITLKNLPPAPYRPWSHPFLKSSSFGIIEDELHPGNFWDATYNKRDQGSPDRAIQIKQYQWRVERNCYGIQFAKKPKNPLWHNKFFESNLNKNSNVMNNEF